MSINRTSTHPAGAPTPVAYSLNAGLRVLQQCTETQRRQHGQFLTPAAIAEFMAYQFGSVRDGARILDPAAGSGTLACAMIEQAIQRKTCTELFVDCVEIDPLLCSVARAALAFAGSFAAQHGVQVHTRIVQGDFILNYCNAHQPDLFAHHGTNNSALAPTYDYIIANPPYFKLNRDDPRARATAKLVHGNTNIYTLFLAIAAHLLADQGQAGFIVPRSFCSGAYFGKFRRSFLQQAVPLAVHTFESRMSAFKADAVLQENVIFAFRKRLPDEPNAPHADNSSVTISSSQGSSDLARTRRRTVALQTFATCRAGETFFRIPLTDFDEEIINIVDTWNGSLAGYGLSISTGPVVAFRAEEFLTDAPAVDRGTAVPLLWMQNVQQQQIMWPTDRRKKPQGFLLTERSRSLLVPMRNYVILRRFSAKEDVRRLVAAPLPATQFPHAWLGLENHLNYIYSNNRELEDAEIYGLAALFNSACLDRYVRMTNGTTQVNAAELRALPLPPLAVIRKIGQTLVTRKATGAPADPDAVVFAVLRETDAAFADIPLIREARIKMGKIQEAQEILKMMGLPKAQQNEISALTLLVLAQLSEENSWSNAKRQSLGIHEIMGEMARRYDRKYAENTRETIRRQVIHQFVQAGIAVRNPDEPTLPTNSPRTHYALSAEAIRTIRAYGTDTWQDAVATFITSKGALLELYQKQQDQHKIPLILENGEEYHLSPGKHNELQAAIVEEFGPRFAPGARLLYLGDTAQKTLILDKAGFATLGIPAPSHDKLPDVVLYDQQRNWLYLIEAVTSHGPVSPKRRVELEEAISGCSAGIIYVSAFPDFTTFKAYLTEIAWETEVWLAELPGHLIHFNGDRFLGPRT